MAAPKTPAADLVLVENYRRAPIIVQGLVTRDEAGNRSQVGERIVIPPGTRRGNKTIPGRVAVARDVVVTQLGKAVNDTGDGVDLRAAV
jgi:co-chaperonin GroES (HSP10)